ncbi:MAG: TolC family protein, partial [Bacteroidales bacterium]|nr:TolC family protein [Bacteroidales bacterium]
MRKILYMLLFLSFSFAPFLSAQPYTLEDCKQMALEHNARLKEKQLDQEAAQLMRREALSYFLPNVSLAGMGFQAAAPIMEID